MQSTFGLNEEIDDLINKKLSDCDCNPCTCSEQKKDKYFMELKDILARFNKKTLGLGSENSHLFKKVRRNFSNVNN
jgi:hypothetical protein